jgi:multisubunit Na+/H+ antiporter MnhB subunit
MVSLWAVVLLVLATAVAVLLMLVVRRFGPPKGAAKGFMHDPVPPAGVFSVLGVAFAVLLAFVLFLAFEGYLRAQDGASREAVAVTQLLRATSLFPEEQGSELRGDLECYARAVVSDEWPRMAAGGESAVVGHWIEEIEATVTRTPIDNARSEVTLAHWLDEMTERREGRRARLAEATGEIPAPVWLMLVAGALVTVLYILIFADRRERWWVQAAMMGTIAGLVVSSLLVIAFLDDPFTEDGAYIPPDEMSTTIRLFEEEEEEEAATGQPLTLPCDEQGRTG